jgi:hypothetical protein
MKKETRNARSVPSNHMSCLKKKEKEVKPPTGSCLLLNEVARSTCSPGLERDFVHADTLHISHAKATHTPIAKTYVSFLSFSTTIQKKKKKVNNKIVKKRNGLNR